MENLKNKEPLYQSQIREAQNWGMIAALGFYILLPFVLLIIGYTTDRWMSQNDIPLLLVLEIVPMLGLYLGVSKVMKAHYRKQNNG